MSYGLVDSVGDVMQMNLRVEPVSGDSGWFLPPREGKRQLAREGFAHYKAQRKPSRNHREPIKAYEVPYLACP